MTTVRMLPYVDGPDPELRYPLSGDYDVEEVVDVPDDVARRILERTGKLEIQARYPRLLPAERFSDNAPDRRAAETIRAATAPEETGENSTAVWMHIVNCCAGWKVQPTAKDFYDAVRAETPTARQKVLLQTWAAEATPLLMMRARAEGAYTWRSLVGALHRAGLTRGPATLFLNTRALPRPGCEVPEYPPDAR